MYELKEVWNVGVTIVAKIHFPWIRTQPKEGKKRNTEEEITNKKYKMYLLQDETVKDLYQRRLEQKLEEFRYDDIEETYMHMKKCIKQASDQALGIMDTDKRKRT